MMMTENNNIDQKIFDFVYHEALNYATLQVFYNHGTVYK